MSAIVNLIKWLLILIGAIAVYYMVTMQAKYGITSKIISEVVSPQLHEKSTGVYMDMANTLLDTGDIVEATIVKNKVAKDLTVEDIEEAMSSIATEKQIKEVGTLPLSEQVQLQLGKDQRFLKIYQYCKPTTAMTMVEYSDAFSAYLPCRIALIQDEEHFKSEGKKGDMWLYSLNMDMMIYGGKPLPPHLYELALQVKDTITAIQQGGAEGDF